jgi:hypothetical protein
VKALALQLDGETENLKTLHRDFKEQRLSTADYTEVAEQLLDSTTALYSVVFDLVSTIWNINRPADHPLKSFPPRAATVRHEMEQISVMLTLKAMSQKEQDEIFAKLGQKTQAEDKS